MRTPHTAREPQPHTLPAAVRGRGLRGPQGSTHATQSWSPTHQLRDTGPLPNLRPHGEWPAEEHAVNTVPSERGEARHRCVTRGRGRDRQV